MTPDGSLVALLLTAAVMHAAWNAVVKTGRNQLVTLMFLKLPNMAVASLSLLFLELPRPESWPYLLASTAIVTGYYLVLVKAYESNDLNFAYPLARGVAPVGVLCISALFAGEPMTGWSLGGVLIISAGVILLAFRSKPSRAGIFGVMAALGVGLFISLYTVVDGIGARLSGDPFGYTAVLNILAGLPLCILAIGRHGWRSVLDFRHQWLQWSCGGALMLGSYAIVVYALTRAPMATVAALRETGVIFAALIGAVILRESFPMRRIVAAAVVAAGIAVLSFRG